MLDEPGDVGPAPDRFHDATAHNDTVGLTEPKLRGVSDGYQAVALQGDSFDIPISGKWTRGGRVFARQVDPLPATILAVGSAGSIPIGR